MSRHSTFAIALLLGALLFCGIGKTSPTPEPDVALEARRGSYRYGFLLHPKRFGLMISHLVVHPSRHAPLPQLPKPSGSTLKRQLSLSAHQNTALPPPAPPLNIQLVPSQRANALSAGDVHPQLLYLSRRQSTGRILMDLQHPGYLFQITTTASAIITPIKIRYIAADHLL